MRTGKIYIGTSGWNYRHWRGRFYPGDLPVKDEFPFYCSKFSTVELNNSFYHLPSAETFAGWRKKTPAGFIFSVKASRYLTHMKKLIVDQPAIDTFFDNAGNLQEKLGPVLFQLPPRWKLNIERFQAFMDALPKDMRCCFEFRDTSWYDDSVYDMLSIYNHAFCIYELAGHMSPLEVTADFVYVRLHGPGNKYQGSYSNETLQMWGGRCLDWQLDGKDVYVYFDNDQEGYAAFNAETLLLLISQSSAGNRNPHH